MTFSGIGLDKLKAWIKSLIYDGGGIKILPHRSYLYLHGRNISC